MDLKLSEAKSDRKSEIWGESRAFVLLESARLRGEMLMASNGRVDQYEAIHREIGMAGYVTCAEFDTQLRHDCVAMAVARLSEDYTSGRQGRQLMDTGRTLATMFSETIAASDALASELADHDVDEDHRDRLHLVHAHVMSACELLDESLTVLELEGAGFEA